MKSCEGCQERTPWCHGRNEDGTYRCEHWKKQEEETLERRKKQRGDSDYSSYRHDVRKAKERRVRNHRTTRGGRRGR